MTSTHDSTGRGTALITGASSGIGLELSKLFARDGYDLVLVARGKGRLDEVAADLRSKYGVGAQSIAADLSSPGSVDEITLELQRLGVRVEALVNAAGFGGRGPFAEADIAETLAMLQVNVVSLTHLTRNVLAGMVERRSGKILNVASTAAFQPGPLMAVYYASKSYVLSLSEAIAYEAADSGVTVTALCPGPTATGFQARADMTQTRLFNSGSIMQPGDVARIGYLGLMHGKLVVVPGLSNRAMTVVERFAPRRLVLGIVKRMHEQA